MSSRTLWHFFVSSPLCSGRGGFIPCKHLDLLVRWSDLYVTSVKIQETHRNRSHFHETLYIFSIFCYPFYHVLPFQRWANEEILLRRFFPSKVGGRPAWLGDSVSQDGLTNVWSWRWYYSPICEYMSVYGCKYVYLVWYIHIRTYNIYIYIYWHTHIYTIYSHIHIYIQLPICRIYLSSYQWIRKQTSKKSTSQVDSGKPPAGTQLFEAHWPSGKFNPHEVYLGNKNPWEMAGIAYYYIRIYIYIIGRNKKLLEIIWVTLLFRNNMELNMTLFLTNSKMLHALLVQVWMPPALPDAGGLCRHVELFWLCQKGR